MSIRSCTARLRNTRKNCWPPCRKSQVTRRLARLPPRPGSAEIYFDSRRIRCKKTARFGSILCGGGNFYGYCFHACARGIRSRQPDRSHHRSFYLSQTNIHIDRRETFLGGADVVDDDSSGGRRFALKLQNELARVHSSQSRRESAV